MNKLLVLTFSSFLALSINNSAFCTGQSTLRHIEDEESDPSESDSHYARYPFITKAEEIDPTFNSIISQYGNSVDAAVFLSKNVVSPWVPSNDVEDALFTAVIGSTDGVTGSAEFGEEFKRHFDQIHDSALKQQKIPTEKYCQCLDALDIEDKEKKYLIREALIRKFEKIIHLQSPMASDDKAAFLNYMVKKKSAYASYRIMMNYIQFYLTKYPINDNFKEVQRKKNLLTYHQMINKIEKFVEEFPDVRKEILFQYLAVFKSIVGEDLKTIASLYKKEIDYKYEFIEKYRSCKQMDSFMKGVNNSYHTLAITYIKLADREFLRQQRTEQIRYLKKAVEIYEDIFDDQINHGVHENKFHRASLYQEIGESAKADEHLQKWQEEQLEKLKKTEAKLKRTKEKRIASRNAMIKLAKEKTQNSAQYRFKQNRQPEKKPQALPSIKKGDEDISVFPVFSSPEKEYSSLRKEKVKTKKRAKPQEEKKLKRKADKVAVKQEEVSSQKTRIEDLLSKKAYQKFCELFSMYEEGNQKARGINSIDISMHDIKKLLNKIHQGYEILNEKESKGKGFDPSKGHGSHAKGEIENEGERVVFTLSKKQYLLPYQIGQLIKGFIKLGYYPRHLKDALITSGNFDNQSFKD